MLTCWNFFACLSTFFLHTLLIIWDSCLKKILGAFYPVITYETFSRMRLESSITKKGLFISKISETNINTITNIIILDMVEYIRIWIDLYKTEHSYSTLESDKMSFSIILSLLVKEMRNYENSCISSNKWSYFLFLHILDTSIIVFLFLLLNKGLFRCLPHNSLDCLVHCTFDTTGDIG